MGSVVAFKIRAGVSDNGAASASSVRVPGEPPMSSRGIVRAPFEYTEGIRSYKSVPKDSTAAKAPYVDHGTSLIDPRRYVDPNEAKKEWDKMWTKVWTVAGFSSDIPNVGDWFKYDLGTESFVIVRGDDHKIRAFYNVCPHRGNQIVRSDFGTAHECFHCAFHGWEFSKKGQLLTIKEPETFRPEVIADAPGLTPVRCDEWGGMVFVCMDDAAEPLLDSLGVIPDHLAPYDLGRYRVFDDITYVYDANWKTTIEAFLEFYHADQIHPELGQIMETYFCQYDLYPKGVSRMILPVGNAPDKVDRRDQVNEIQLATIRQLEGDPAEWKHLKGHEYREALVKVKRRLADRAGWDHCNNLTDDQMVDVWNYHIFPNVTFNLYSDVNYVQIFRPHPTDPTKCLWRSITLIPPARHKEFRPLMIADWSAGPEGWDGTVRPPIRHANTAKETGYVLEQDAVLVPGVQRGITSRAFKGSRLSEQEMRIRHYLAELDKYLSA
jgi:phenylpropionate dioxygenase-like ring-hydroxylating dioxygenase large terminal subunit